MGTGTFTYRDLGQQPYGDVLALQENLFQQNLAAKEESRATTNTLLLCEHNPVFTIGKTGKRENILVNTANMQAELFHVQRGGDVTFHGPGQLVAYPIFDLDTLGMGVAEYINKLEETILKTLLHYGIEGERIHDAPGIWIRNKRIGLYTDNKICAIGARVSRHVTMHGLAININTDLSYFQKIISCGLTGKGVTSLAQLLGHPVPMDEYKILFLQKFAETFNLSN